MSAESSHLSEIHRQLRERFSLHSIIAVTPIKGDPPDQYEVTYNINGLSKTGRGGIVELAAHTIEVTIPFGFPHFPPSCKPKSDTYHPDFDPAAICLGDFWSRDKNLPDLIIHIGRMINGEVYSTANGFNEDACTWYNSHTDFFPLADIDWPGEKKDNDVPGNMAAPTIDTLDDSDLATDFDFLSLDESKTEDLSLENSVAAGSTAEVIDLDLLQFLESKRKFFELRNILKNIDITSEELHRLASATDEHIGQATDLHREAKNLEHRGEKKEALAAFKQVVFAVSDFPDIETHINRLRQTFIPIDVSLSEDVPPETGPAQFFNELAADDKASAEPGKIVASEKRRERQPSVKQHLLRSFRPSKKQVAGIFGGIVAVCIAGYGYYYLTATDKMGSAEAAFLRCRTSIENGQFEEAKQGCEQALTATREIRFFHRERIVQLSTDVNRTMQSERFVQGLNGRVFVDGEYLPKKDAETIETLRSLLKEANDFFLQEDWQQAKDRYEKILAMTKKEQPIPDDIVTDSRTKLGIARFRMVYNTAEHALQNSKWLEAVTESNKAESFLSALPDGERRQYADSLMKMQAKGTFESHREKGDTFFAGADWQNAIATYRLALSAIDMAALPEHDLEAVRGSMNRAELYSLIDQGNNAFGSGSWDEAIDSYRQAEVFLADPQRLENMDDIEQNRRKLSRVILQARIVRDRQSAERYLAENDMEAASKVYRQLIEHIKGSQFSSESEFSKINIEISATIQTLDKQIYIAKKAQYLKDEYRTIFIASYPNAIEENLANPSITFVRESGDKMIFKMQCTESGERPLILILHYAFDKKNGRWEVFSEQPSD